MRFLVIIPAGDRRNYISGLIEKIKGLGEEFSLAVVCDASEDGTPEIAKKAGREAIEMPIRLGMARRIQRGLRYRSKNGFDRAVVYPADCGVPRIAVKDMADRMERTGRDIVLGSRFVGQKGRKKGSKAGDGILRMVTFLCSMAKITDPSGQLKAFGERLTQELSQDSSITFEADTISYLVKSGATVEEVKIDAPAPPKRSRDEYITQLEHSFSIAFKAIKHRLSQVEWRKLPWRLIVLGAFGLSYLGFLLYRRSKWYVKNFGRLGFMSIVSTLTGGLKGTPKKEFLLFAVQVVLPSFLICAAIVWILQKILGKGGEKHKFFLWIKKFSLLAVIAISAVLTVKAGTEVEFWDYLEYTNSKSTLYEDHYVDPRNVEVTFPEKKRNLIYILLESMETTYVSKDKGGQLDYDVTPFLYNTRMENINFSDSEGYGGFPMTNGATWTIGAITAQTSGVPLVVLTGYGKNSMDTLDKFLPGLYNLNSLLADNGYYQAFMCGSDASYAGRDKYFTQHGVNKIYDLFTAYDDGIVPRGYNDDWWGYEDHYLYEYAKQEISEMARQDQPFAFTLLTVDTHRREGHLCEWCTLKYGEQYENVLDHADRMIREFMDWLVQQDFYEDTTVVIAGDHLCMEMPYLDKIEDDSARRVYNTFINSAVTTENTKNRHFLTVDMFPTIVAAMGGEIEGDRLGLGTNLFSDTPTLREEYGSDTFNLMLLGGRDYYEKNFYQIYE